MKNIIAMILIALMAIMPTMAETTVEEFIPEVYMIEGVVSGVTEEGILLRTEELGEVLIIPGEETLWEGAEALAEGDYAYVDYNGMMTRSIPARISAMVIRSYRMEGVVTEVFEDGSAMLINTETYGDVYVTLPGAAEEATAEAEEAVQEEAAAEGEEAAQEEAAAEGEEVEEAAELPKAGDSVTVYFNGAMTMSLPGRINAGLVIINPVTVG